MINRWILCLSLFTILALPLSTVAQAPDPLFPAGDGGRLQVVTHLRHESAVIDGYFSPLGTIYVAGTLDGQLHVWQGLPSDDWLAGEKRFSVEGYVPGITVTGFNSDETQLVAALGADGSELQILDARDGSTRTTFNEHDAPLLAVDFAADDQVIVSWDLFETLHVWASDSGDDVLSVEIARGYALSQDKAFLAVIDGDTMFTVYDLATGDAEFEVDAPNAQAVNYSPGGRWIATWGQALQVWDSSDGTLLFEADDVNATDAVWTPDGRFLMTQGFETATVWAIGDQGEINAGDIVDEFSVSDNQGGFKRLVIAPDGQRLVTVDQTDGGRLWQITDSGDVQQITALQGIVDDVLISPDSRTMAVLRLDFLTRFWDLDRNAILSGITLPATIEFSPTWQLIAAYTGSTVVWRALPSLEWDFATEPIARPLRRSDLRPVPTDEIARLLGIDSSTFLFAIARTEDAEWIQVELSDGMIGWLRVNTLLLLGAESDLLALPVLPTAETTFQDPNDDLPFLLGEAPTPLEDLTLENGVEGCFANLTVLVLAEADDYTQVDCGAAVGWLPTETLVFGE